MIEYEDDWEEMMLFCDEEGCDGESMLHGSWKDCIYEAKQQGWELSQVDNVWFHSCPRHRLDFGE